MLLKATIGLWAPAQRAKKTTTFWARVKRVIGPKTEEVEGGEVHTLLQAAALVGGAAQALDAIGVDNAIALIVDGKVVYEDRAGRPDDLDAMVAAMQALTPTQSGLTTLELVVEHLDTGLHVVASLAARGVHQADDTTAEVTLAGRVVDLCPRTGEADAEYRARLARALPTAAAAEAHVTGFLRFVERLRGSLTAALPDVRIGVPETGVRLRMPGSSGPIDAYARYCPEVDQAIVDDAMWARAKAWTWRPPWTVIDGSGQKVGLLDAFDAPPTPNLPIADAWTVDGWSGDWT